MSGVSMRSLYKKNLEMRNLIMKSPSPRSQSMRSLSLRRTWDIFLVGKGLDVSGVATLAFLGMAGGEEESWEEKESVSREGEEVAERSLKIGF